MKQQELVPHLFRTEFGKITTVLCKVFGLDRIDVAEDITSETFATALETWPRKGIPENPTAWLYTVAKNNARNYLERNRVFREKISPELEHSSSDSNSIDIDMSVKNITDSQLQMLFATCHPSIPAESQIGLALRILCGFGIEEIANAFLTNKDTINKRLYRARKTLREKKIKMEMPGAGEIDTRLETVLTTLYLLFNEGYYSESNDLVLRKDLCLEAIRLTYLLADNEEICSPNVLALLSLMCFHSSRFEARRNDTGELIYYDDQDESLWNEELISKGAHYLNQASGGEEISKYHLEAGIAWWHTVKTDSKEKWEHILHLYNQLLSLEYSPIAALNRTFALSKVHGIEAAIPEAENLKLNGNQYYHTLLGELYKKIETKKAIEHFEKALLLAKTNTDKKIIQHRIGKLRKQK